jgi:flagellar capping protein FliD
MNINALQSNALATSSSATPTSSQSASAVSAASQPFAKVDKRLQADVDTTTAKLSKLGLLKSAVAGGQQAAQKLSALSANASASDITVATANFFNAFNSAVTVAQNAAGAPGSSSATQSANRVIADLKRALSGDPASQSAMKKLGFAVQKDGTLTHDVKKFAAALTADPAGVRAALASLGGKVDAVAAKELASAGTVDAEMTALTQRQVALAAQQKALKGLVASMAKTPSTVFSGSGLAAYQSLSSR